MSWIKPCISMSSFGRWCPYFSFAKILLPGYLFFLPCSYTFYFLGGFLFWLLCTQGAPFACDGKSNWRIIHSQTLVISVLIYAMTPMFFRCKEPFVHGGEWPVSRSCTQNGRSQLKWLLFESAGKCRSLKIWHCFQDADHSHLVAV